MDKRVTAIKKRAEDAAALILEGIDVVILDDGWLFSQVGEIGSYILPPENVSQAAQSILCAAETHFALVLAREHGATAEVPASAISKVECDEW